jgi:hypothetical protein
LVAQRADVGKSTQRVRNDQARARGKIGVGIISYEGLVSNKLVLGLLNQLFFFQS